MPSEVPGTRIVPPGQRIGPELPDPTLATELTSFIEAAVTAAVAAAGGGGGSVTKAAVIATGLAPSDIGAAVAFTTTAVKTSAYTATSQQEVPCNTTGGAFPIALPAATVNARSRVINVSPSGTNVVTLTPAGTDAFIGPVAPVTAAPGETIETKCYVAGYWSIV